MSEYKTKASRLAGTRYREIYDQAFGLYKTIRQETKRRPYVRSAHFDKQKIFLDFFWKHLHEKNWRDRARRLRFFPAAIELIKNSHSAPLPRTDPNDKNIKLYRFTGITVDDHVFHVQIKEDLRTGNKFLLSAFPEKKKDKVLRYK